MPQVIMTDSHPPVDLEEHDLLANNNVREDFLVPIWASLSYWCEVADPGAGGVSFEFEWVDPTGETRTHAYQVVSLADDEAITVDSSPICIVRQSATSPILIRCRVAGGAGSSEVGMRAMLTDFYYENCTIQQFTNP